MTSFIKTADADKIILVIDGQISHAINPQCDEWQKYEQFIADGGIEIEAQPSDCHEFVNGVWVLSAALEAEAVSELIASLESAVNKHINDAAIAMRYESILTAVTYASDPTVPQFQSEGLSLLSWRSACWAKCYELLAVGVMMSAEELIAQLPKI